MRRQTGMRIGEAAAAAALTPRAVRYYEQQGLLEARRTPSGHREYGLSDIRRLRTLRELLEAGLTIADVRSFAHVLDPAPAEGAAAVPPADGAPESCEVRDVSLRRLADLEDRIDALTQLRDRLAAGIADRFGEAFDPAP
ncbi:MerR family transcriptional regulator [Streptomyces sp. N2-109]|uniref:MerR family transcriptional regulator n=1 Tax=Streptomyces gossypii TaxID=2883101 RepID=A0ABT2JZ51_9ACTN|nr:MerR family transcriptional regulator [Streptomyces gossypii]MCT2593182.1 MerR family transcriptional regulator [Streptomyces gossypii]